MQHEDSSSPARRRSRLSVSMRGVLLQVLDGMAMASDVSSTSIHRVIPLVMLTCVAAYFSDQGRVECQGIRWRILSECVVIILRHKGVESLQPLLYFVP